jgi:uncharacterized membrane protein YhaH (DUF805 family)
MDWRWLLLSFEGRINRAKFWLCVLLLMAVYLVAYVVIGVAFGGVNYDANGIPQVSGTAWALVVVLWLAGLYMSLAIYAKRWHDRDKSGWWTLIVLVPIIGSIWLLVECGCLPGTEGPNRFGPDPLAGER